MNKISRKITISLAMALASYSANAQISSDSPTGTFSPYSQFGLGQIIDPASGMNNGMGGVGIGMRDEKQVNFQNPASYSAIDSLTFIFDAGASAQFTNFTQDSKKINRASGSLDYVAAIFRVAKGVGVSFGYQPFTQVGYDYTESGYAKTNGEVDKSLYYSTNYHARHGGIQQFYLGAGWEPIKGISLGANISLLSGDITRDVTHTISNDYASSYTKEYSTHVKSYKADFGLQGQIPVNKTDKITIGATYSLGHKLGADQTLTMVDSKTGTVEYKAEDAFALPHMFGAGISFAHGRNWKVAADYSLQQWSKLEYPVLSETAGNRGFVMSSDYYLDRHHFAVGGEYCANDMGRKFMDRIRYRLGASYSTPYYKIGNSDGPKEISVSAGFGIPIVNGYNNRSVLNIAAQWVNTSAPGLIKENSFRIKIGFTFNERWFMKWKLE